MNPSQPCSSFPAHHFYKLHYILLDMHITIPSINPYPKVRTPLPQSLAETALAVRDVVLMPATLTEREGDKSRTKQILPFNNVDFAGIPHLKNYKILIVFEGKKR